MATRSALPVAVVGAGPYGLSAAAHLRAAGIETRVFGDPMATWRDHMPAGMYLKSTPGASSISAPGESLTYERYCHEHGRQPAEPLAADDFIDYGMWFQQRAVPEVERGKIEHLEERNGVFALEGASGSCLARAVVVASGLLDFVRLPSQLSPLHGGGSVTHSSDHGDLGRFKEKRVAVIGSGQSALECAVLLAESGATVHLCARKPQLLWGGPPSAKPGLLERGLKPASSLGPGWSLYAVSEGAGLLRALPFALRREIGRRVLGPSGAWWLRPRFDAEIRLHLGRAIGAARASGSEVALDLTGPTDVETIEVDHVLAATGYEVRIDSVRFIDSALRARIVRLPGGGSPRLAPSFESSVPGLYFPGLAALATFGPLLRFVCGTRFASRRLSASLVARR